MARLKNNGQELLRWQHIIDYPVGDIDCIEQVFQIYSLRSNGRILRKTTTISNVYDSPSRYSSNWKRYASLKDLSGLNAVKERIIAKVRAFASRRLKNGRIMNIELV